MAADAFYCPMKCEKEKNYPTNKVRCPVCGMKLEKVGEGGKKGMEIPEFRLDLNTTPVPKANQPVALLFSLRNTKDNTPLKELEIVHEKPFHLIMVRQDLSWFSHEHPTITAPGELRLDFQFPTGGNYVLYGDFKPKDKKGEVIPVALRVEGEAPKAISLVKDKPGQPKKSEDYEVLLNYGAKLKSGEATKLVFTVKKKSKPVQDIEAFLGAAGHLVGISQDTTRYIHAHPAGHDPSAGHGSEHEGHMGLVKYGPALEFSSVFPKEGLYKLWVQFQHQGKLQSVPFVVNVESGL